MDYEQKYNKLVEAVKVLQKTNPSDEGIQNWVNDNVPELAESKDERVRKEIIKLVKFYYGSSLALKHIVSKDEMVAWLEKQGKETNWKPSKEEMDVLYGLAYITNQYDEHKEEVITRLYQDLKREFFNGSSYENMFPNTEDDVRRRSTIQVLEYARSLDIYNQYGKADIDKNIAWLEKQGEQKSIDWDKQIKYNPNAPSIIEEKPAWSEEDDSMFQSCIGAVATNDYYKGEEKEQIYDWLKSLKQRHTWKPSEEQMKALKTSFLYWKGTTKEIPHTERLESLYEQLKQL